MSKSDVILEAVSLAARLMATGTESEQRISEKIYLGLYSARHTRLDQLSNLRPVKSHLDVPFVHWLLRNSQSRTEKTVWRRVSSEADKQHYSNGYITARSDLAKGGSDTVQSEVSAYSTLQSPGFVSLACENDAKRMGVEITRIYLALTPSSTPAFFGGVVNALKLEDVPATFKVLAHPRAYFRSDAAVIYVNQRHAAKSFDLICRVLRDEPIKLRPIVPLGTEQIMPGLAWADSPDIELSDGIKMSFGMWITSVLIEAAKRFGTTCTKTELATIVSNKGRDLNWISRQGEVSGTEVR